MHTLKQNICGAEKYFEASFEETVFLIFNPKNFHHAIFSRVQQDIFLASMIYEIPFESKKISTSEKEELEAGRKLQAQRTVYAAMTKRH